MPIKDGVTAAAEINRETPLPIVLLTATTDAETVARAREAGVMNYLLKPFREEQLAVVVDLAIDQYIRVSNLEDEVGKLKETLETRKLVEKAKGVLIKQGLSEPDAYRRMQKLAMDKRKSLRAVAEAILLMEG
jgi:response regulator NasT